MEKITQIMIKHFVIGASLAFLVYALNRAGIIIENVYFCVFLLVLMIIVPFILEYISNKKT